jgi:hypothetical protein
VRWWLAALSVVLGVLVLVAAGLIAHDRTWLRDSGAAFWSGLAVNVGTSLLLAAVLIGLERVIVRKVREDRQAAVTQAAEIAAESAAQRTVEAFRPELDDLDRRIRGRASTRVEDAAETAQRVADLGTYEAVREALAEADRIGAIPPARSGLDSWSTQGTEVIVPAGWGLDAPRMRVTFYRGSRSGEGAVMFSMFGHREATAVDWVPDWTPEQVFDELQESMVRSGLATLGSSMSAEALFWNLSYVLGDALLSRRAAPGAWHSTTAPVIEMVLEGCVMTDDGIEILDHGLVVKRSDFGFYLPSDPKIGGYDESIPPRPESVNAALWNELIRRGEFHYRRPDPNALPW